MVACVEPALVDPLCVESPGSLSALEQNYSKAKFIVRLKRRNGRVKHFVRLPVAPVFFFRLLNSIEECGLISSTTLPVQYEDLYVEGNDVKFDSAPASTEVNQSLVPKVSACILDSRNN